MDKFLAKSLTAKYTGDFTKFLSYTIEHSIYLKNLSLWCILGRLDQY